MGPFPSPPSPRSLLSSSAAQRSHCAQGETPARKPRSHTEPTAGPDTYSSLQERKTHVIKSMLDRLHCVSVHSETTGTHLVHLAHWTLEIHLAFGQRPCWGRHLLQSDLIRGERCAGAAGSTAGQEIQPGSRWDGRTVPWSSASTGLPSPHLETESSQTAKLRVVKAKTNII